MLLVHLIVFGISTVILMVSMWIILHSKVEVGFVKYLLFSMICAGFLHVPFGATLAVFVLAALLNIFTTLDDKKIAFWVSVGTIVLAWFIRMMIIAYFNHDIQ